MRAPHPITEHPEQRVAQRDWISRRHEDASARCLDRVRGFASSRRDHGNGRLEVVQYTSPQREIGFERRTMETHGDIDVGEVARAVVVRKPRLEEDEATD